MCLHEIITDNRMEILRMEEYICAGNVYELLCDAVGQDEVPGDGSRVHVPLH